MPYRPLHDLGPAARSAFGTAAAGWLAVGRLAEAAGDAATSILKANDEIDREQSKDEAARLSSAVPARIEELEQGVTQPFSESNTWGHPEGEQASQTLTERFAKGMAEIRRETLSGVTTKFGGRLLGRHLDQVTGGAQANAQALKFKTFRSEQQREVSETLMSRANAAIATRDPALRQNTINETLGYIESKTVLTPRERGGLAAAFREDVGWGSAVRAVDEDPDRDLAPLLKTLSADNGLKLEAYQRAAQARKAGELREAQAALDRGMTQYVEGVERHFVRGLKADTITEDDFQTFGDYLSSEKLTLYQKMFTDRQVQGGPGDADVIRAFKREVYSPRLNSEAAVTALSQQLEGAYTAKLVPEPEFTPMLSHLQTLRDRFSQRTERAGVQQQGQQERAMERAQAEKERVMGAVYSETQAIIKSQLQGSQGMLEGLDVASQEATVQALEDLSRETGLGRLQDARAWWEAARPRYLAKVEGRATQRMNELANSLSTEAPPSLRTDPLGSDFSRGLALLLAKKDHYRDGAAWLRDVRAARDRQRLAEEVKRLKDLAKPTMEPK